MNDKRRDDKAPAEIEDHSSESGGAMADEFLSEIARHNAHPKDVTQDLTWVLDIMSDLETYLFRVGQSDIAHEICFCRVNVAELLGKKSRQP